MSCTILLVPLEVPALVGIAVPSQTSSWTRGCSGQQSLEPRKLVTQSPEWSWLQDSAPLQGPQELWNATIQAGAPKEYLLHSGLVLCDRSLEIAGMEPENLTELKAECWRDIGNMRLGWWISGLVEFGFRGVTYEATVFGDIHCVFQRALQAIDFNNMEGGGLQLQLPIDQITEVCHSLEVCACVRGAAWCMGRGAIYTYHIYILYTYIYIDS